MTNRTCRFDGCERTNIKGYGLCSGHCEQNRLGKPLTSLRAVSPRTETLMSRIERQTERSSTCWNWTGNVGNTGYGRIRWQGELLAVHRVVWEITMGAIPTDKVIDHICRNRLCIRPAHLHAVSVKQNNENISLRSDNKSGIRGVSFLARTGRWRAQVGHRGANIHVGYFGSLAEAEVAVIRRRNELFTNNPSDRRVT